MATEKQIAANRANAKRSTGPKTAAGRLRSSRNAVRHGLSCPLQLDFAMSEKADAIARLLAGVGANDEQLTSTMEVAHAHVELLRIRRVRAELMAAIDVACCDLRQLRRLVALDRYERYAHTKRRRAARKTSTLGTQGG
jgi:hypothetical protein